MLMAMLVLADIGGNDCWKLMAALGAGLVAALGVIWNSLQRALRENTRLHERLLEAVDAKARALEAAKDLAEKRRMP